MNCPKCHYQLRPDQKFCPKCGTKISGSIQFDQEKWNSYGQQGQVPERREQNKTSMFIPILIIGIIICALGIAILTVAFSSRQETLAAPPATEPPVSEEIAPPMNAPLAVPETAAPIPQESTRPDFSIPIYYDANGGKGAPTAPAGRVHNHEMTITHPNTIPTRQGYTFIGWLYENDSGSEIEQPGQSISFIELYGDDPITYYARWQKNAPEPSRNPGNNSGSSQGTVTSTDSIEGYISTDELKVRSGPSTYDSEVGRLYRGDKVVVTEQRTGSDGKHWGRISTGWICLDNNYVTFGTKPETNNQGTVTSTDAKEGYVSTDELRIRSGPSIHEAEVGRLYRGDTVTVTEQRTGSDGKRWGRISAGWICLDNNYVTFGTKPKASGVSSDTISRFTGSWGDRISQRAHGQITYDGANFQIHFEWANSAFDGVEWDFVGYYDSATDKIYYSNGVCTYWSSSRDTPSNGSPDITRTTQYSNGSGSLYIQNGELYWIDDVENAGSRCIFEKH